MRPRWLNAAVDLEERLLLPYLSVGPHCPVLSWTVGVWQSEVRATWRDRMDVI